MNLQTLRNPAVVDNFLAVFDILFQNDISFLFSFLDGVGVKGFSCNGIFTLGFGCSGVLLSAFCGCLA